MTLTNCLDVITKLWPSLEKTGSALDFQNFVMNSILKEVCDWTNGCTNDVKFECNGNDFKMIFDGVEFTK